MGTEENINFSSNKPSTLPKTVQQPMHNQQWQKAQTIAPPKPDSAKKSVKFAIEEPQNDHFTKPSYMPPNMPNAPSYPQGMGRSNSMPSFPQNAPHHPSYPQPPSNPTQPAPKNTIPSKPASNSGFKPSFLTSQPPSSSHSNDRYHTQAPASYPSGYSDKAQLGASAAKITELLKKGPTSGIDPFNQNGK